MNEDIFNELARRYDDEKRMHLADIILEELKKHLKKPEDKVLLDYGAGTGLIGLALAGSFERVHLADSSSKMIEVIKRKMDAQNIANAEAHEMDLLESETVIKADTVIMSLVLLHAGDHQRLIQKLHDVLAANGEIYIVDFDKNEAVSHPAVTNGFTHREMEEMMKNAGFENIKIRNFYEGKEIFMKKDASLFIASASK